MNQFTMLGAEAVSIQNPWIQETFRLEQAYLLSLEPKRLLAPFRETAGLPKEGEAYGGWEKTQIRGHTMGHYLTAMAQAWSATKDRRILDRLEETAAGLADCQREDGFLFASPEDLFDRVERREPAWVPWYTMDKLAAGLTALWVMTPVRRAEPIVRALGGWICRRVLGWPEEIRRRVLAVEYGGMNHCLYALYALTGEEPYLLAARRFDQETLLELLARGEDRLDGLHANATIPKVLGALKGYAVTGGREPMGLQAAEQFWKIVTGHHTYATGGNSEWEHFGKPDILDAERTACNCETCNIYNMRKLSQLLFSLTGDKKYLDYDAWAYVNGILSSQNHETGMTTYFQPMASGCFKVYSRPYDQFWCCTGTGMENFTKPWEGAAYERGNRLYLARLVSARIRWQGALIRVEEDWLHSRRLRLWAAGLFQGMSIALRRPGWADSGRFLLPPGITCREEGGFWILEGSWQAETVIHLELAWTVRHHGLPDGPRVRAYSCGPFLLSAHLHGAAPETTVTGVDVTVPVPDLSARDYLIDPELRPLGGGRFRLRCADGWETELAPHFLRQQERYGIYFPVFRAGEAALEGYLREKARKRKAMERFDVIPLGNDQYELAHRIRGKDTDAFADGMRRGRVIRAGGYVSYRLRVPAAPWILHLRSQGARDLRLDGQPLPEGDRIPMAGSTCGTAELVIRCAGGETRLYDEICVEVPEDAGISGEANPKEQE